MTKEYDCTLYSLTRVRTRLHAFCIICKVHPDISTFAGSTYIVGWPVSQTSTAVEYQVSRGVGITRLTIEASGHLTAGFLHGLQDLGTNSWVANAISYLRTCEKVTFPLLISTQVGLVPSVFSMTILMTSVDMDYPNTKTRDISESMMKTLKVLQFGGFVECTIMVRLSPLYHIYVCVCIDLTNRNYLGSKPICLSVALPSPQYPAKGIEVLFYLFF